MLLQYVLVTYGALVGLVGLVITVHDLQLPTDERDPLFETACDVILIVGLVAGVFCYAFGVASPDLKLAWKPISLALLVYAVISNVHGRRQLLRQSPEVATDRGAVAVGDVSTIVCLGPSVVINLLFAFG